MKVILQFKEIMLIWGAVLKQNKWAETKERVILLTSVLQLCVMVINNSTIPELLYSLLQYNRV